MEVVIPILLILLFLFVIELELRALQVLSKVPTSTSQIVSS